MDLDLGILYGSLGGVIATAGTLLARRMLDKPKLIAENRQEEARAAEIEIGVKRSETDMYMSFAEKMEQRMEKITADHDSLYNEMKSLRDENVSLLRKVEIFTALNEKLTRKNKENELLITRMRSSIKDLKSKLKKLENEKINYNAGDDSANNDELLTD